MKSRAQLDRLIRLYGIGATLGDDRAVPADDRGFALGGAADEQLVRVGLATPGLRNPRNPGFCLRTMQNGIGGRIDGGPASGGLDT